MSRNSYQINIAKQFIRHSQFTEFETEEFCKFLFSNSRSMQLTYNGHLFLGLLYDPNELGVYEIINNLTSREIVSLARNLDGPYCINRMFLTIYDPEEVCEMNLIGGDVSLFAKIKKI